MADYLSLLIKLLDGLPDKRPAARDSVYDRARRALAEQLRTVTPPLTEDEIAREANALETAIRQVELRFADEVAPAPVPERRREPRPDARDDEPPEPEDVRAEGPEPVAIRRGGRRQRPTALLLALVLLAVPVAVLAWLWRDQPRTVPETALTQPAAPATSAPPAENKFAERIGGAPADQPSRAGRAPAPPAAPTPAEPPRTASAPVQGELAVAQRAIIFEENQADPQRPSVTVGRALWRQDVLNAGQGMALETVIRGTVELPGAGLTLNLLVRRNLDAALPASHTIELTFINVPVGGAPARVVRDVALPMMRPEETIRGVPLAGLPVPVKENLFLIGLSDLKGDVERNSELLLRRNWMELPVRFASGQKAALLFDKGVSGERVFLDAFRQWGQSPP